MDYDFDEVGETGDNVELAIVTNKLVHDLAGDIVWMIGRHFDRSTYYLYGKFRVSRQRASEHPDFDYEVAG
ncbi:MAG TPA: hypothetical protein VLN49_10485, partial [Gemmatimonadaceae bacterium]|nr:hypothetical protein [Gemmatimonadaceae bacterium]